MVNIQLKRIYEPAASEDGFRILVDRLWPRGIKKDNARIDLWAKDITPTTALRQACHSGQISWPDFTQKYHLELLDNPAFDAFIEKILNKKTVTFVFAAKNTDHNHVKILMDIVMEKVTAS